MSSRRPLPSIVVDPDDEVGLIVALLEAHSVLSKASNARFDFGTSEFGEEETGLEEGELEEVGIETKVAVGGENGGLCGEKKKRVSSRESEEGEGKRKGRTRAEIRRAP